MRIRFWGVRGSLPAPLNEEGLSAKLFEAVAGAHAHGVDLSDPDAVRAYLATLPFYIGGVVGGNTTCVEIRAGEHTLVLDAGSGIRPLGLSLLGREYGRGQGTLHLFFTHAHWDHLMGFPFFKPAFVPGNRIICYAVNHHPLEYLGHLMTAPTFFPIVPEALPAHLEYVTLQEGEPVTVGPLTVTNMHLHHPGIAYAYRVEEGRNSFVLATDAEFKELDDETIEDHVQFFRGADVLAFDSQFSLKDAFAYEDWGHSSAMIGVDLAIRAGVKRLVTIHHDPNHTDRQIWEIAEAAQEYARLSPGGDALEVSVGHEGLEIYLSGSDDVHLSETVESGALILALSSPLSRQAAAQIRERLLHRGQGAWRQPVAVDLSLAPSAEAEAIAALAQATIDAGEGPLTLVAPAHRLRRSLSRRLDELGSLATVFDNRASALAAIVGPAHLRLQDEVIAGRYHLMELVTTDDQTALYQAHDMQMDRTVVGCVLNPGLTHSARLRYLEGCRAWSRLSHPAIQQVLDILPDEGGLTTVILEFLEGQTLKDYSRQGGAGERVPLQAAVEVGCQLLEALAYLHDHGVTHGELRPEALFWNGQLKVPVSGIAPYHLRGLNAIWLGPSAYHAPERVAGEPPSMAGDQFSSGVILYQMLSGVHPFESENGEVTLLRLVSGAPPPRLRTFNPAVPPSLEGVVLRLLAPQPAGRFASAHEACQALRAVA